MSATLVIGAGGKVGQHLLPLLVSEGAAVRAATRRPEQWEGPGEAARFDFDEPATFAPALEGVDRLFLINPPSGDPSQSVPSFLTEAARSKRKIVMMTAMGTEHEQDSPLRKVELALEDSGSPYVILRPNWFMDNFHEAWLTPIREAGTIPLPAADARTSLINARDIAASAAAALTTDRFDGRGFTLTGPAALTYTEAAAVLSEAAGREIRYVPVDDETFVRSMTEAGAPEQLARYLAFLFSHVRAGATALVSPAVEELTGRRPHSLADYARLNAHYWRRD